MRSIFVRFQPAPHNLLQILHAVQACFGYLPEDALDALGEHLKMSRAQISSVAEFYAFFHLKPHGKYRVLFSNNITDRMQGSAVLRDELCHALWVEQDKVSEDGLVSVGLTSCIGMSDQGPAMLVNGLPITRLESARIDTIAERIRNRDPMENWPHEWFRVDNKIYRRDWLLNTPLPPGAALSTLLTRGEDASLIELKTSGLRGRGGAGFPTADKWSACRSASGEAHYVVCNADEGEPGTFKDRVLLTDHADLIFEGMTACARLIGAQRGFLYLRAEYRYLLDSLDAVLQRRRESNLLGTGILGHARFDFDIEIHLGAGAYVCGEESALLESLEGKRGIPRIRPPFPVQRGYLGQPTVVNNVETFAAAGKIMLEGSGTFSALGTPQSRGTKLLSVSGDCAYPGLYEYPFGTSIRQILHDCGASDTQAVQIGGAAGLCLSSHEFDRCLGYEDAPSAGAFMIFNRNRDMFEMARNFAHFFAHESCGFCTPCRVGTTLLRDLMDKIHAGRGSPTDLAQIEQIEAILKNTSHCGLGQSAYHPISDTLTKFRSAYDTKLVHTNFSPAFDLDAALATARQMTGRDDIHAHLKEPT
ncbi:MAG: NAD(P)H-dependent oxidoreductase subunit E [Pseudomonadota bacterium]